jgi:hypothetical protein
VWRAANARPLHTPKIGNSSNFREVLIIIVLTIDELAKRKVPKSKQPGLLLAVLIGSPIFAVKKAAFWG